MEAEHEIGQAVLGKIFEIVEWTDDDWQTMTETTDRPKSIGLVHFVSPGSGELKMMIATFLQRSMVEACYYLQFLAES